MGHRQRAPCLLFAELSHLADTGDLEAGGQWDAHQREHRPQLWLRDGVCRLLQMMVVQPRCALAITSTLSPWVATKAIRTLLQVALPETTWQLEGALQGTWRESNVTYQLDRETMRWWRDGDLYSAQVPVVNGPDDRSFTFDWYGQRLRGHLDCDGRLLWTVQGGDEREVFPASHRAGGSGPVTLARTDAAAAADGSHRVVIFCGLAD